VNTRISRIGRGGAPEPVETGEIHSVPGAQLAPKSRLLLSPSEEALSLPPPAELPNAVAPLTDLIGARLTVDNPAWSGDPVPAMRLLQKTLVAASLERGDGERGALLRAIELVEQAVQMRLRWQQMKRSDAEGPLAPATTGEAACAPG
jgi:hypothetical protein